MWYKPVNQYGQKITGFLFWVGALLVLAGGVGEAQDMEQQQLLLEHQDPEIRQLQAEMLGRRKKSWAVQPLIDRLNDRSPQVQKAAHMALQNITDQSFPPDPEQWEKWYREEGKEQFPPPDIAAQGQDPSKTQGGAFFGDGQYVVSIGLLFSGLAVIILLISLALVGGYRMKQLKQTMRRAEKYVSQAEKITETSDNVLEDLEQKKVELRDFLSRLKEEKEGEIERHAELLEQNSSRKIREEMRSLRERAEKEVTHTLNEQQNGVSRRIEREVQDLKKEMLEELKEEHERFQEEAESYRIFLEASFLDVSGKEEEALDKYEKTLEKNSEHLLALQRKGGVLRKKERYEEALETFEKALDLSPESPAIYYEVSATYARMNRKDKMLEYLQKSVSINSEYKDEALNDVAFRDYWGEQEFKDLTET